MAVFGWLRSETNAEPKYSAYMTLYNSHVHVPTLGPSQPAQRGRYNHVVGATLGSHGGPVATVPVLTPVKAKKELEPDNRWDMSECQV